MRQRFQQLPHDDASDPRYVRRKIEENMDELTPRRRDVVRLIGGYGLTYEEAGEELGLARATMLTHARRIRDRMGVRMDPRKMLKAIWIYAGERCIGPPPEGVPFKRPPPAPKDMER